MSTIVEPLDLSELRSLRDKLIRARASSERRVSYTANGVERTVEFRLDSEMRTALADIERRIEQAQGKPGVRVAYLRSERGFLAKGQ